MMSSLFALLTLLSFAISSLAGSAPLSWDQPGYTLNRPLPDGVETGYHVVDPKDGFNYLGYGASGKEGYDFANRGFARLLDVDIDFYASFEFKHFQIFEYSKSRTINYTQTAVDVSADQKAQLAEQARTGIDSPHLDADSKASKELLANDGKDVDANHQSGSIRDKLSLTIKRYDELKFRLKSNVEIQELINEKKKKGQAARFYGYAGEQQH